MAERLAPNATAQTPLKALRWPQTAPALRAPEHSRTLFRVLAFAAMAPLASGVVFFGFRAAIVAVLCVSSCLLFEWACFRVMGTPAMNSRTHAVLTGLLLTLTLPHYAFALVWGAFFFLLDPVCDFLSGKSLTRRWLAGERQEIFGLLAAGLICGVWWEMWNYPAAAKWIYALPALNFGKIFEMPVLGYLGFLPFALECAVMYNFMQALEERVLTTPRRRRWFWLAQLAFWLVMFVALDVWTVISFK